MQLSICIIAKNEEKNIERCLQCLSSYKFGIVVVDTGSTDRTREIASHYTNQIYDFAWCDDFAAAKNFAVSKAANPYVMVLDSDEFLEDIDVEELCRQINAHPNEVGRIQRRNFLQEKSSDRKIWNGSIVFSQRTSFIMRKGFMSRLWRLTGANMSLIGLR